MFLVLLGLCGKNNLEKAWCDIVVDIIMEIAKLAKEFAPFYRTEKDDEKFVSFEIHISQVVQTPYCDILFYIKIYKGYNFQLMNCFTNCPAKNTKHKPSK